MSLIRFLSSGSRGLTKGAPPMGRYRLPDGRLIPNFGTGKNPFESNNLPPQEEPSSAVGVTAKAALTQAASPSPVTFESAARPSRLSRRMLGLVKGLLAKLKSFVVRLPLMLKGLASALWTKWPRRAVRSPLASSSNPQMKSPVQAELSLEKVRVVRNDLTDTDYEVVCAETATASPLRRPLQTVAMSTETRPLGRLAERLFSHKTH